MEIEIQAERKKNVTLKSGQVRLAFRFINGILPTTWTSLFQASMSPKPVRPIKLVRQTKSPVEDNSVEEKSNIEAREQEALESLISLSASPTG